LGSHPFVEQGLGLHCWVTGWMFQQAMFDYWMATINVVNPIVVIFGDDLLLALPTLSH
jgi:hypothetical protein